MSGVSVGVFGVVRESHAQGLRRLSDMETNLPGDGATRCGASVHAVLAYHLECHLLIDEDGQLFMSEPTGMDRCNPTKSNKISWRTGLAQPLTHPLHELIMSENNNYVRGVENNHDER